MDGPLSAPTAPLVRPTGTQYKEIERAAHQQKTNALSHTFGTHLSRAGVPPRTAQAAMHHSSVDLTMNIYTDPTLLEVTGGKVVGRVFSCSRAQADVP
jgi:integrase